MKFNRGASGVLGDLEGHGIAGYQHIDDLGVYEHRRRPASISTVRRGCCSVGPTALSCGTRDLTGLEYTAFSSENGRWGMGRRPWAEAWQMLERLNTKILTNSPTRDVGCLANSNVRGRLTGSFTSGGGHLRAEHAFSALVRTAEPEVTGSLGPLSPIPITKLLDCLQKWPYKLRALIISFAKSNCSTALPFRWPNHAMDVQSGG